jgi:hypothetical protein
MPSYLKIPHTFYGYQMIQMPSNKKLSLYCGAIDAKILRDLVSVDNAVGWDKSSGVWKSGGRNRTVIESHVDAIEQFLTSGVAERLMPSALVISIEENAFDFKPIPKYPEISGVLPGEMVIIGRYESDGNGSYKPCAEKDRVGWVLDGQHRIKAFRKWSMPDPYPVNVILIRAWKGGDYEDVMRHQTYELNMGRPLSEDFKASIREQYDQQIGHKAYREEIGLSWIRKDLESRGTVFSPEKIVGATNLRVPYVVTMSFLESLIKIAFESDSYLSQSFNLDKLTKAEVTQIGKYLYDFYEGVRLSLGLLNPKTKGTIGTEPEVEKAVDYWDIATETNHKQRILHNVGLKAITRGLLHVVMRGSKLPQSPVEVAKALDHMRGIAWHNNGLQSKKDDWVVPLAEALTTMYHSKGTSSASKKYNLVAVKYDKSKNIIDQFSLDCHGW